MELLDILMNNNNSTSSNSFLVSNLESAINSGIDISLSYLLQNYVEEKVSDVKNSLLKTGLKSEIGTAINSAINLGKSAIGVISENFENIFQVKDSIESGNLVNSISDVLDVIIDGANSSGLISDSVSSILKTGKSVLLGNISNEVDETIQKQIEEVESLEKNSEEWKKCYEEQDFEGMEEIYEKIKENLEQMAPVESTINKAREIENIHTLIKNNGGEFNLTEEELKLASNI